MKKIYFALLLGVCTSTLLRANSFEIKIKVKNLEDTVAYLGYHFGDKKYLRDTAKISFEHGFVFSGKKKLKGGLYFFYSKNAYFEFIIDEDQEFQISTDSADLVGKQKIKGSDYNQVFLDFQHYMNAMEKQAAAITKEYEEANGDSVAQNEIRNKLTKLDQEVKNYQESIIRNNPRSLPANLIKATLRPVLPNHVTNEKRIAVDPNYPLNYYKKHYFDSLDFSDERLLRTPIYLQRITEYLEKLTSPYPDSIYESAVTIIDRAKANDEVFKYTLSTVTSKYEASNIMGQDAIFVKLAEHYYMTGKVTWLDVTALAKIKERVTALKPTLIGMKAHNLILQDTANRRISLYDLDNEYVIIYFFDPNCGYCKKKVPILRDVYNTSLKNMGVEVFAVSTVSDLGKWKKFVQNENLNWINGADPYYKTRFREYYDVRSTPTMYIIDSDKKIIAKRLDVEQIEDVLKNHQKINNQQTN